MKVLIVSNGLGEDLIGLILARHLSLTNSDIEIHVMPLIGLGKFYQNSGLNIIGKPREMPSGGFLVSFSTLLRDILSGLLWHHLKQIVRLILIRKKYDKIICVGDVFCLLMGSLGKKMPVYFLPTAKSNYIQRHYTIEKYLIKKLAVKVFPRDDLTAESFRLYGINSYFYGNVMMDAIEITGEGFGLDDSEVIIGILPGSRQESYQNFSMILEVVLYLYQLIRNSNLEARFLVSVPPTLDQAVLEKTLIVEGGSLNPHRFIFSGSFGDIIHKSNFVLGMAGTANEQAAGLGKPVFTWSGRGPQTCYKRIEDQQKLLGCSLTVAEGTAAQKAKHIWKLVQQPRFYEKCAKNAVARMGKRGAALKIAKEILG